MKIPGLTVLLVLVLASAAAGQSASAVRPASDAPAAEKTAVVSAAYPGLATGSLTYARLAELPKGTLLHAGGLTITEKNLAEEIARRPRNLQDQFKKNGFFVLEELAAKKLLLRAARAEAAKAGRDISKVSEQQLISGYLKTVAEPVKVSDDEIAEFYQSNKDSLGGAPLEEVKPQISQILLQDKEQQAAARYVRALGQKTVIEVAAAWAGEQAILSGDNPVDRARRSGKPSLVDFGAKGCQVCELMAPLLADLKKKFAGRLNVEFVYVPEQPLLAARYGIQSIPAQVFFDQNGQEVFRHTGFFPRGEIEKKLAELGVK